MYSKILFFDQFSSLFVCYNPQRMEYKFKKIWIFVDLPKELKTS